MAYEQTQALASTFFKHVNLSYPRDCCGDHLGQRLASLLDLVLLDCFGDQRRSYDRVQFQAPVRADKPRNWPSPDLFALDNCAFLNMHMHMQLSFSSLTLQTLVRSDLQDAVVVSILRAGAGNYSEGNMGGRPRNMASKWYLQRCVIRSRRRERGWLAC